MNIEIKLNIVLIKNVTKFTVKTWAF